MLFLLLAGKHPPEHVKSYVELQGIDRAHSVLWHEPGSIDHLDLYYGAGGRQTEPQPPFKFVKEDPLGTSPKMTVLDGRGRTWSVKFGPESRPDVFSTRLA